HALLHLTPSPPIPTPFPYTPLFRSHNFFVIQLATNVISTELPLQLAAGFTQAAFEPADPQAYGTNSLRQALRSDNQEGHNAADEQFKKTDIKHTRYLSRLIESRPYLHGKAWPLG